MPWVSHAAVKKHPVPSRQTTKTTKAKPSASKKTDKTKSKKTLAVKEQKEKVEKVQPPAIVAKQQPPPKSLQVAGGTLKSEPAEKEEDEGYQFSLGDAPHEKEPGYPEHEYRPPAGGLAVKMDPEWHMRVYVDSHKREDPYGTVSRNHNPAESVAPTFSFERKF